MTSLHLFDGGKSATDGYETKALTDQLTAELAYEPTAIERIVIEQIGALAVRLRRLRAAGHHEAADDVTRLLFDAIDMLAEQQP